MATPTIMSMKDNNNNQNQNHPNGNETPPPPLRKSPPRSASPPPPQPPCLAPHTSTHQHHGTTRTGTSSSSSSSASRLLFGAERGQNNEEESSSAPSPIITTSQSDSRTELSLDSMSLVNSPPSIEEHHNGIHTGRSPPPLLERATIEHSPITTATHNAAAVNIDADVVVDQNEAASLAEARRIQQEEEDSIALARMLMAQEAVESYALHADYLRNTRNEYTEEDFAALQAVMAEEDPLASAEGDGEHDGDGDDDDGHHELSYDTMLRIEEQIGDVKQERWALIAKHHIDALPQFTFEEEPKDNSNSSTGKSPSNHAAKDQNDSDIKCLVCQIPYENGETLRRLPCGHCFHSECVDQWLANKDFCPYCRQCIVVDDDNDKQKS